MLLLAATFLAGPAFATVELRVEAKPSSLPIEAFITVTDAGGAPVTGLTVGNFDVKVDGTSIVLGPGEFTLPPSQDPNQRVSIVFAMDYSNSVQNNALAAMQTAIVDFINSMSVGDYAAIIKFSTNGGSSVVQPFIQIDAGGIAVSILTSAVMTPYPGGKTPLLDGINLAVDQFDLAGVLPPGPKAVIAITDGVENNSTATETIVLDNATGSSIPVFTIGVGMVTPGGLNLLTHLATQTGGDYLPAPNNAEIAAAYGTISTLLNNEYLLTFPSAIGDCASHTLLVTVSGQATAALFRRCDGTPDPFSFTDQTGVTPSAVIISNAVTISGIEGPTEISVTGGEYSNGCTATFTASAGMIDNNQTVCVRHTASPQFSANRQTTLTVGDELDTFKSTTSAAPPSSGGGGGALGVMELIAGLAALAARRKWWLGRESNSRPRGYESRALTS